VHLIALSMVGIMSLPCAHSETLVVDQASPHSSFMPSSHVREYLLDVKYCSSCRRRLSVTPNARPRRTHVSRPLSSPQRSSRLTQRVPHIGRALGTGRCKSTKTGAMSIDEDSVSNDTKTADVPDSDTGESQNPKPPNSTYPICALSKQLHACV
jgi:hypothetical protein